MTQSAEPHTDIAERRRQTTKIARRLRKFINKNYRTDGADVIETLVATILSQNTSDVNSNRAYIQLRATYPTWEDVAQADQSELAVTIRAGGLAEAKSRTIINALRTLKQRHGDLELEAFDTMSDDAILDELTSLKGVGLKTASCVLMFSLGRDICAVDTHVHRIVNRLGIVTTSTPDKSFHELRGLLLNGTAQQFHVDAIRFGRQICKSQRPHCFECPLYDLCQWERKEEHAIAGVRGARPVSGDLMLLDIIKG